MSCTGRIWVVDVRVVVGVAQALTSHGEKWTSGASTSASRTPECERGVQDLSCTGRIWVEDVRVAVGVAQALTPHGEKWTTCLRLTHA